MNDAELLKYMDDNGIIKLSCVRKQIEMADTKAIFKQSSL